MFDATPAEAKRYGQHCADYHKTMLTMLVFVGNKWHKYKQFYPSK